MKKSIKTNQKKTLFKSLSLVFLIVFLVTVVVGLLVTGSSVALFTSISNSITLNFVAEEPSAPSLQAKLDHIIQNVQDNDVLLGANHLYRPTGGNPAHAWSIRIEDYLQENAPDGLNRYGYLNPVSGSGRVINQPEIPTEGVYWNPAVFITTAGRHTNPENDPDPRLWGTMIIFNTGVGENTVINYFVIDENGGAGTVQGFYFSDYQ